MEKVCNVSDVPPGTMRGFTVKYAYILLANVDGNFYAVTAVCPHMGGYIPIGTLEGKIIKCPVHGSQYDVTTGKLVKNVPAVLRVLTGGGSRDLKSYPVSVEDETVFVEV
ncbi:MAG TPA: Rieske 2Fe-2S domain-containing protein [Methanobacterium sp.]|nr:MAG: Rieske 2Fe-2S domain-containing protein [Methanobacterium sp.]HOI71441.1 Rieske 2Fe-2S domain-containing protein [Methanobacterium sp.]